MPMNWPALMSRTRIKASGELRNVEQGPMRGDFERDWDRILFSNALRRMHDKTQVFPLPEDDIVHSRLTHSLEVSSVGRSLGNGVGLIVCPRLHDPAITPHDVGHVVAAACLAHDIGNPPFGHAGENAIARFFASEMGKWSLEEVPPRARDELQSFEGNAQGFRLITRLQLEANNGLQLTAATLGAFCKYPREAGPDWGKTVQCATKKYGAFQEDMQILTAAAQALGLIPNKSEHGGRSWSRHPLAFLVEAADDICYSILDIEDGVRLHVVDGKEAQSCLKAIAGKHWTFAQNRLEQANKVGDKLSYLRTLAIDQMINECIALFREKEDEILDGTHEHSLCDKIQSREDLLALKKLASRHCYTSPGVIEIELAGYEALDGLLSHFIPAVVRGDGRTGHKIYDDKIRTLLRQRGVSVDEGSTYSKILRVTDYVSGMTDRHALSTYRRIKGISIPGRVG